jgi:hypothetical protein
MTLKIALRLRGVDLRDAEAFGLIGSGLRGPSWEAREGMILAILYSEDRPPAAMREAVSWAGRIEKLIPGARVVEAHDELASAPEIAERSRMLSETAQAWVAGRGRAYSRPFPAPRHVVGGGLGGRVLSLYAWRDVVAWLREVIGIDPEEGIEYLTDAQHAALNAELAAGSADPGWHPINVDMGSVIADVEHLLGTRVGMAATMGFPGAGAGPQLRFTFE